MKFACIALFGLLLFPLSAQEGGVEANKKLRATVQKWTAVMKEIQESRQSWREERQIYSDSRESLKAEAAQLEQEVEAAKARKEKLDSRSQEKIEQKATYDQAREALRAGLDRLESKVSAVLPLLPEELTKDDKLSKAISDHKGFVSKEGKEKEGIPLNSRLGAMVTILVEAEKFNQVVTSFDSRSARVGGQDVLLEGIYFGLAMGFAADKAGNSAIQLTPGPDGWQQEEISDPEVVEQVRQLINVGMGKGEVRLVPLPLTIAK